MFFSGACVPGGAAIILFAEETAGGFGLMGFGLFFLIIMLISAGAPGSRYTLNPDGLSLKRGASRRTISFGDIRGAKVLSEKEAGAIITEYMTPAMQSEAGLDIKNWLKSNRKMGSFIRFCTVPVIQSKTTTGNALNITSFSGTAAGSFVILRVESGEELLLSPKDVEGFSQDLASRIRRSVDLSAPYPHRSTIDSGGGARPRNFRRKYLVVSLVTATTLITAVALYLTVTGKESPIEQETEGLEPVVFAELSMGWIDDNTFRSSHDRPSMALTVKDLDVRKRLMRDALYSTYMMEIADKMAAEYYSVDDLDPSPETRQSVLWALQALLAGETAILVSEQFDEEVTEIRATIEIQSEGLRKETNVIIERVLSPEP